MQIVTIIIANTNIIVEAAVADIMGATNMDNKDTLSKLSFWNKLTDNEKETAVRGSVIKKYDKGV